MSRFIFFSELFCQLCEQNSFCNSLFYVTNCFHPVCENCLDTFAPFKNCQISDCRGVWMESKMESVEKDDNFYNKQEKTQQMFVSPNLKQMGREFFSFNGISPKAPIFVTRKFHFEQKYFGERLSICNFFNYCRLSFLRSKKLYLSFKERLKCRNLMLLHELPIETFLKSRMRKIKNLKISDFFANIPAFSTKTYGKKPFIECRCLNKIESLLEGTLDKIFSFKLYNNIVLKLFTVIHESGFEIDEIDETQEMLLKFDAELSERNSVVSSSFSWPMSNYVKEPIEQVVESLDFHKSQDLQFRKMIDRKILQNEIWKLKKIRKNHQINTSLKFRKFCESTKKNIVQSSIFKNRMTNFLCFLFPNANSWMQLVHFQTDVNSKEIWMDKCFHHKSTVVVVKSDQFVVGAFNEEDWNFRNSHLKSANSFLFSINKKKKYPLCRNYINSQYRTDNDRLFELGNFDILIHKDFKSSPSMSDMTVYALENSLDQETELFGSFQYLVQEIEVFKIL